MSEEQDGETPLLVTALDSLATQMRAVAWMLRDDARRLDGLPDGACGAWTRYRHADGLMVVANKVDDLAVGVRAEQTRARGS